MLGNFVPAFTKNFNDYADYSEKFAAKVAETQQSRKNMGASADLVNEKLLALANILYTSVKRRPD